MLNYLLAIGLIFVILAGGIGVQVLYRRFAARHPELGPFRKDKDCGSCIAGSGCATGCLPPSRRD